MTTIAFRSGILAADTRVTAGDSVLENQRKVYRVSGSLLGMAGDCEQCEILRRALRKRETPELDNLIALMITSDRAVFKYEGKIWVRQRGPYFAIGTGDIAALSAMDAGADAITAVRIGMKRDKNSGGRVQYVKLRGVT